MITTTIVPGNVYITTSTNISGNTITHEDNEAVEIFSARIEYSYINQVGGLNFKSKGDTLTDKPRRIIDLKKITKTITVTGLFDDESTFTKAAFTKRNNLLTMAEFRRSLTLVWGTGNYRTIFQAVPGSDEVGTFILKMRFRETAGLYGVPIVADPQPFTKYDVEATFIIGKDI